MSKDYSSFPAKITSHIFTEEGPRGGWRPLHGQEQNCETMEKCLGAGRFGGLMPIEKEVNVFLKTIGLPDADFIEQPEYEDFLKSYLVLRISKKDYEEKILPIRNNLEEMGRMEKIAKDVLCQSLNLK